MLRQPKKIEQTERNLGGNRVHAETGKELVQRMINEDMMDVGKMEFILFMAKVMNCSAQTESRTKIFKIIIRAADKYLNVTGITLEEINKKNKDTSQFSY